MTWRIISPKETLIKLIKGIRRKMKGKISHSPVIIPRTLLIPLAGGETLPQHGNTDSDRVTWLLG